MVEATKLRGAPQASHGSGSSGYGGGGCISTQAKGGEHALISCRFGEGTIEAFAREINAALVRLGVKTFMVDAIKKGEFGDQTNVGLYKMHTLIALGDDSYGARTRSDYSTFEELKYAAEKGKYI